MRETQYLLTVLNVPAKVLWRSNGLHHSPLLLKLPAPWLADPWTSACAWIALDAVSGVVLAALASTLARRAERHVYIVPAFVAAWYVQPLTQLPTQPLRDRSLCGQVDEPAAHVSYAPRAARRGARCVAPRRDCAGPQHGAVYESVVCDARASAARRRRARTVWPVARALWAAAVGRMVTVAPAHFCALCRLARRLSSALCPVLARFNAFVRAQRVRKPPPGGRLVAERGARVVLFRGNVSPLPCLLHNGRQPAHAIVHGACAYQMAE